VVSACSSARIASSIFPVTLLPSPGFSGVKFSTSPDRSMCSPGGGAELVALRELCRGMRGTVYKDCAVCQMLRQAAQFPISQHYFQQM